MFTSSGTAEGSGSIDDLANIDNYSAALVLSINGKFDARISELRQAKSALDSKQYLVNTIEEAQTLEAKTKAGAQALDERIKAVDSREEALVLREKKLAQALIDMVNREGILTNNKNEVLMKTNALAEDVQKQQALAAQNASSLADQKRQLDSDRAALERQKQEFNAKLQSLRA